ITDIELEEILLEIFYFHDPYDPRYYLKVLGSKKLSKYLLNEMGLVGSVSWVRVAVRKEILRFGARIFSSFLAKATDHSIL
ncbi:hypothetical protein, partial [Mesotoga sp.]|uniref:hypothetical protein n=1 Tax=Mesotoga sp. TaxID=2053577 RepID=UPI001BD474A3